MSIVYNTRNIVYCNSKNFLRINYFKVINNFRTFKSLLVFKDACSKALGNFEFYTKSLFPLTFFTTFSMFLLKRVNLNSNIRNGKKYKQCLSFLSTFFGSIFFSMYITKLIHFVTNFETIALLFFKI